MPNKTIVSILGAGAMGWGIAYILSAYQRATVRVWDRNSDLIVQARKTGQNLKNSSSEIILPPEKTLFSTDLREVVQGSDLLLLAVPSFAIREMCQKLAAFSLPPMLMIAKGMERNTSLLPFQIAQEVLVQPELLHVTGAGYGKEVHKEIAVTEVLASPNQELREEVKDLLETRWLTIRISPDLLGVQLGGALKNVMVIAMGLAGASEEHPSLRAQMINQGVEEMTALGRAMGAEEDTFQGPAGRGDLEISSNPHGRNFRLGQALAERGVQEVQQELQQQGITVEGLHTAFAAYHLAQKYGVELPLVEKVYQVIYERS